MNILIGLTAGLVLFLCLILSMYIGYKLGTQRKPKELTIEEKEAERIKKMNEGMNNIMNYNEFVARGERR